MKPIVCVTDFSDYTVEAAQAAAVLAQRLGETLRLVRSVDEQGQFPAGWRPRLMNDDRPRLAREAARLRQLGLEFETALLRGVPDDGIVQFVGRRRAQLVVAGGAPTGRLEHWLLGCMAEEIAESSPVPTLAVRSAAPFLEWARGKRPLRILVGADSPAAIDGVFKWLGVFGRLGPCVVLAGFIAAPELRTGWRQLCVRRPSPNRQPRLPAILQQCLENQLLQFPDGGQLRLTVASGTGRVADDLAALAGRLDTDLLVVGTHQRKGLARLSRRSVSRGILRRAPMNVLCVPLVGPEPAGLSSLSEFRTAPASSPAGGTRHDDSTVRPASARETVA